jgi:outer membrane lipopolysaccharide assembly protein LptE/RlpB
MTMPVTKTAAAALLALALAACGFHARSHTVLPTQLGPTTVVASDPYSPIAEELAAALERAGVPAADAEGNGSVLRIVREQTDTLPLAVDEFARAREYQMTYRVDFALQGPDGKPLLPPQRVELRRQYSYDANASIGSPAEAELIQRELRRDMEAAILRRIEYALRAEK